MYSGDDFVTQLPACSTHKAERVISSHATVDNSTLWLSVLSVHTKLLSHSFGLEIQNRRGYVLIFYFAVI
jgi:hypothetical protein